MVKVEARKENGKVISLKLSGHANSGEYGKDLVCAGVSSIITGGASALENITSFNVKLSIGNSCIELKKDQQLSKHDEIVMETILVQLQTIEHSYPKFIEIEIL